MQDRISEIVKDEAILKPLKKTAIEWIKYLHEMNGASLKYNYDEIPSGFFDDQLDDIENEKGNFDSAIQWIAWFFEIKNKKGYRWCNCCSKIEDLEVIK